LEPGYEQKAYHEKLDGGLCLVASPDGRDGSLSIHQDALVYASRLKSSQQFEYSPDDGRTLYIHIARGNISLNENELSGGDGVTSQKETEISVMASTDAEILLFDLP